MRAVAAPRWAISFADLGLILLGCFVMLHAMGGGAGGAAAPSVTTPPAEEFAAADLFEPGDARLTSPAREQLHALGAAAGGRELLVTSRGADDQSSARLDAFELAAARAAAVARALREGGVSEGNLDLQMESEAGRAQTISIGVEG